MNAITYWIDEHFSFHGWRPYLSDRSFTLICIGSLFDSDYYGIEFDVLGFGFTFWYWPDGKYGDSDEAGA